MVEECDLVVVGSGAGGLTAACRAADLGLSVVVVEKSDHYGGTSAVSGGTVWIPNNHHMADLGEEDDPESALAYLRACSLGAVNKELTSRYVESAPDVIRYLESETRVRFRALMEYPDYLQHLPGARTGRTLEPIPFDGTSLGDDLPALRPNLPANLILGRVAISAIEARQVLAGGAKAWWILAQLFGRYFMDLSSRWRGRRDRRLTLGAALVGALRGSLRDRGVPVLLSAPMQDLVVSSDGTRVEGVRVTHGGESRQIMAKRAVLLACGGFEHNPEMRSEHLPAPTDTRWSVAPGGNTGDGIQAGQRAGGRTAAMSAAWFTPAVAAATESPRAIFCERALPGCVVVNGRGERFVNEAAPYNQFVLEMYENHRVTQCSIPAWMIFDARFRRKYPCGPLLPGTFVPDRVLPARVRDLFVRAEDLPGLARKIGVPYENLSQTLRRFAGYAESGVDEEFGKGNNVFDAYYGDPRYGDPRRSPNPCLGPVEEPPFYAMQIQAGDIGTCGGLETNSNGQVLGEDGAIPGLYAIGNTAASMTQGGYPGAGGTLGPAILFGFLAAEALR